MANHGETVDDFPLTEHWLRDHVSHTLTPDRLELVAARHKPINPQICASCEWPGSMGERCTVCCDMVEAIMLQPGLSKAHHAWALAKRQLNKLGL